MGRDKEEMVVMGRNGERWGVEERNENQWGEVYPPISQYLIS